ncbi:lipocalin family protein [Pigmentiphaga soli]|uniref:Outer membrane lipoprotein Blc n=1 Tax=Pigmentiphaga soli TaxID=1007095 RepID=A0ABP8H3D0_9BURK
MHVRLVLACLGLLLAGRLCAAPAALTAVEAFDTGRYAGKWYEIARYPNRFQSACLRDVTAEYRPLDNGKIEVVNRCERDNGNIEQVVGLARPAGAPGKFEVRFAPSWLSWLPWVWSPYWVVQLGPDYRYAVVSEPGRKYLWVLSRSPWLSPNDQRAIYTALGEQGFDIASLRRTEQAGASQP